MRRVLLIAIAVLLTSANARAQQTTQAQSQTASSMDGLACFENLAAPEYPEDALQAYVDGSVWTWTQITPQGVPGKTETQVVSAWSEAPKLLTPAVERAIHAARIKPDCAGNKVWAVFRYQLHGEATSEPKVTSRTDGPNVMWIESQPALAVAAATKTP
jgi:hypothetical protein